MGYFPVRKLHQYYKLSFLARNIKHDVSENGFCLPLQVEVTQMDPIERAVLTEDGERIQSPKRRILK
jgi:hypothetical protein